MPIVEISLNEEDTIRIEGHIIFNEDGDAMVDEVSYYEHNPSSDSWNDLPITQKQRSEFESLLCEKYLKELK